MSSSLSPEHHGEAADRQRVELLSGLRQPRSSHIRLSAESAAGQRYQGKRASQADQILDNFHLWLLTVSL